MQPPQSIPVYPVSPSPRWHWYHPLSGSQMYLKTVSIYFNANHTCEPTIYAASFLTSTSTLPTAIRSYSSSSLPKGLPQTWTIERQHKTGLNEALRCCTLKSLHPSHFSLSPPRRRLSPGQLYSTDSWVPKGDFSLHLPETWISSFNISRTSIQIISSSLKNLAFCNLHKRSYGKLFLIGWSELSKPSINSAALKRFDFFNFFFNIYQCSFTVHSFVQGWAQPRMRLFIHLVLFQVSSFRS